MWLADRLALSSVLCRQRAVQSMGAQAFAAQAVPLLPQSHAVCRHRDELEGVQA